MAEEVDYSQFYYRREKNKTAVPSSDAQKPAESGAKKRKKRSFKPLLVILLIIVLFGIVFFSADFFTNGALISMVSATLRGNSYEYYLVVRQNSGRDLAYAQSLLVKQAGGSGYIITTEEDFLVVYANFTDRTNASSVAAKNGATYVYTLGFTSKNTDFYNACDGAIRSINDGATKLETGAITDSEFLGVLNGVRADMLALKTELIDGGKEADVNLLEYLIGGIDGLNVATSTRIALLSDVRYLLSGVIVSMCTAAA